MTENPLALPVVTLRGSFVRLDPLAIEHVSALVAAATEDRSSYNHTFVAADAAQMREHVEQLLVAQHVGVTLPFVVTRISDERVVGMTRFLDIDFWPSPLNSGRGDPKIFTRPRAIEIGGTWYASSVQRTALNTESKLLLLTHAFEEWGVERVTFKTDSRNEASQRAIERLGAVREGIRRAHVMAFDGLIRDSVYFSIVAAEWPGIKVNLMNRLSQMS